MLAAAAALFRARSQALLQYRSAAFAAIAAQVFWGLILTAVFHAFYGSSPVQAPIALTQAVTFLWLGQALFQLMPYSIDKDLQAQILNGNVAYELIRPVSLYALWFARSLAMRLIPMLMRCLPVVIAGMGLFGMAPPASWQAFALFTGSVLLALFLAAAITTLAAITQFWTLSGEGILRLLPACAMILSGLSLPLPLFPDWMQPFLQWQPFRGVLDIPCRIYTEVIPSSQAPLYLLFQGAWTMLLVGFGRFLMHRAQKRIVIQGG